MTTDTTAPAPTSAPHRPDDEVAAHVVDALVRIAVVDAGQKRLPYDHDRRPVRRNGWVVQFDSKTDTATVHRDAEKSVLGHTPMTVFSRCPSRTRNASPERSGTAASRDDSTANRSTSTTTRTRSSNYLDEVAAAIHHPTWCDRGACWDRHPASFVEHKRTARPYTWESEHDHYSAQATLHLYAETVEPYPDERPVVELRIGPKDAPDLIVLDNPDDLRKLGQYLITAADDLEWEQDDP